jgi:hypothetical protein
MQKGKLNCATLGVANTTTIGSGVTADETGGSMRAGKGRRLRCIAGLPGLWSLIAAGIFVASASAPARTDPARVPAEIAAFQAQVASLQSPS